MRYSTMEKKGDAQLSAKRQLVSDQLEVAKDHLETLRTKCNLVELHSKRVCDFVSDTFADLKHSLDKKEKEVVSKILVDSSRIKEELSTAKKSAELIIERSRQALECTEGIPPDGDVHCTSMLPNRLLGECLMELLLLPREDLCYCEKFLQYKVEFDVSHLQSLVEQWNPDSFFKDELCDETDENEIATSQRCDQLCPGSSCDKSEDTSFPTVEILKETILSSSLKNSIDVTSDPIIPVEAATAVEESINTCIPDDQSADLCIPFLSYSEGMHLTAYICSVSSPSTFIAQPYGSQLVNFMHELSEFYESDDARYFDSVSPPKVGDVCCAQFSEDGYWYRAEVTAVEGSMPNDDLSFIVEYVDYGNHESLPLHRIRVLDQRFSLFPRQALQCSLAGVDLTPLCYGSGDHSLDSDPQVLTWIKSIVFEKPVDLIVYHWLKGNQVEVDICVPLQALLSSESLSALPSSISADSVVTYTKKKTCANVSLLSMMQSFGLAIPVRTDEQSLSKSILNQAAENSEPSIHSDEQDCLSLSSPNPLSDTCHTKQSSDDTVKRSEALSPMFIRVEQSGKFAVHVCSVMSPGNFYVRPVQESCAKQMNDICNTLPNYFSKGYVKPSEIPERIGDLCCVQSPQDDKWYRGFIINIAEDQGVKQCQVLHIDYGDLHWYVTSQLNPFPEDFCQYPAQAVHCSLYNIYPHEKKQMNIMNEDTDNLWNVETTERFRQLTGGAHQVLVAYVKAQELSTSCVLQANINTTFLVELINTSGDKFVNINEEVHKGVKHTIPDSKAFNIADCTEHSGHIQQWNPMEADFLAPKNNYAYDDEDASIVIQGYRSSRRVCRFYETSKGCMKGTDCQFLHLDKGVSDQQFKETFTGRTATPRLPSVGDWVVVIATTLISVTELFVQLPLGCTHPLKLPKDNDNCYGVQEPELSELVVEMTAYYSQNVFGDRDTLQPHKGEMIAAYFAPEECWYRALVLNSTENEVKVCYVDYGNVEWISGRDIRCIKEEYMNLPFQAVHCRLAGIDKGELHLKEAKGALEELVIGKVLIAHIVSRNCDLLYVHLYACNDDKGIHINQVLAQKGVVSKKTFSPVTFEPSFQPG